MEMFNTKRRDVYNFNDYMDLKKPGFGGPKSAKQLKDGKGKLVNNSPKLKEYQRTVERHDLFKSPHYNSTYKAMGGDLVHKQEKGKNPYDYPDLYNNVGIPVVNVGKATNEGLCYADFESFLAESAEECSEGCECKECAKKEKRSRRS
jgi:hypothetical protein